MDQQEKLYIEVVTVILQQNEILGVENNTAVIRVRYSKQIGFVDDNQQQKSKEDDTCGTLVVITFLYTTLI